MDEKGKNERKERSPLEAAGFVSGIGIQFAACILLFIFAGREADARLETAPWGTVLGIALGFFTGIWATYKKLLGKQ